MWPKVLAIAWAQMRIVRNHLPRTGTGTLLLSLISLLWYGVYAVLAAFLAAVLPGVPIALIREWLPPALLGVFLFWQIVPLFTLSSGWSLQLNKLQIYPVSDGALFGIETLLRLTTAPEMILVLVGGMAGLARHPDVPAASAFLLLLYIPLNLFLSLAIRELFLNAFERNRFRELFAVLLISIAVLPQLLVRTELGGRFKPYFLVISNGAVTPWREVAVLGSGSFSWLALALLMFWTAVCYGFARRQFKRALRQEEGPIRRGSRALVASPGGPGTAAGRLLDLPGRLLGDPMGALVQKEFQSLLRMPRFRVIFGMACIFSVVIFLPLTLRHHGGSAFVSDNFLPIVDLYGLLLLSDVLLLNAFGFDRHAAQLYFVAPVPFRTVLQAKNLTAAAFIFLQMVAVFLVAVMVRLSITPFSVADAVGASAVVGIFFLSIGNLCSVAMPRPLDPKQTFRKQSGGRMQLWFLLSSFGMFLLMGFAFLARWALQSNWALLGVLLIEFLIGLIFYRFAMDSAVARGVRERERIVEALSKGASPIGLEI